VIHLSLIVAYRERRRNLGALLAWYQHRTAHAPAHAVELVLVESSPQPTVRKLVEPIAGVTYLHVESGGLFAKCQLLNAGLAIARGAFVTPYDVDLLPVGDTLDRHIAHAIHGRDSICLGGYRLMSRRSQVAPDRIAFEARRSSSPLEERVTPFVRKQLLDGWRFGVVPLYEADRLRAIEGWDERFLGWGAEDQDVLERYLAPDLLFARSPDLLYLHLHHPPSRQWNAARHTARNRKLYGQKQQQRRRIG
jgi:hypothetical protein